VQIQQSTVGVVTEVVAAVYVVGAAMTIYGVAAYQRAKKQRAARNQAEVTDLLAGLGVTDPPPTYNDMRLPVEYWSRRAALADALIVVKTDGLIATGSVAWADWSQSGPAYCPVSSRRVPG
jgi:hypothetical protein